MCRLSSVGCVEMKEYCSVWHVFNVHHVTTRLISNEIINLNVNKQSYNSLNVIVMPEWCFLWFVKHD